MNKGELFLLDGMGLSVENIAMIKVTRLDGKTYYLNPHMIESMETTPDLTLVMLSGKRVVLKNSPEEVIEKIIEYRRKIGINVQEE